MCNRCQVCVVVPMPFVLAHVPWAGVSTSPTSHHPGCFWRLLTPPPQSPFPPPLPMGFWWVIHEPSPPPPEGTGKAASPHRWASTGTGTGVGSSVSGDPPPDDYPQSVARGPGKKTPFPPSGVPPRFCEILLFEVSIRVSDDLCCVWFFDLKTPVIRHLSSVANRL